MNKVTKLYRKYKSVILYTFFGGCTTLVNIITYAACTRILFLETVSSTIIAWLLSVLFAYVTNRSYVFESKVRGFKGICQEIISFFSCRLLTGGLDLLIMYIFVDVLEVNDMIMKIISNIFVIILNYVASKRIIFSRGGRNEQKV